MGVKSKIMAAAAAGTVLLTLGSCLKNDDETYAMQECYGIVDEVGPAPVVVTDEGDTLYVRENRDPRFVLEDGLRVRMNFTVTSPVRPHVYDVVAHAFGLLLTKDAVRLSELGVAWRDSIGNDPIGVRAAWFGGGRFLNIVFGIRFANPDSKHFINLVVDEENSTQQQVIVTLRHNAFGDGILQEGYGRASFDISGLVPEGQNGMTVVLKWTDYDGIVRSDSGVFERNDTFSSAAFAGRKTTTEPASVPVSIR